MIMVRVIQKQLISQRVCLLTLAREDSLPLPTWQPGAHIDVFLPDGMIRQYSLCGSLNAASYSIAVQLEPAGKGGSRYIHDSLACGASIGISEPRNHFPLTDSDTPCVFMAAGIGITPFIPMMEQCLRHNRSFTLYYAIAHQQDNLLSDVYRDLENVHVHNKAIEGERLNISQILQDTPQDSDIFVCGPAGFISDVLETATQTGISASRLHREYFSAAPIDHSSDGSFEIEIASTGQIVKVAKHESMLEALEDNGFFVPVSCEEGVCGTCITPLLNGEADHRDVFLTDEEKAQMNKIAVCCSRAKSLRLLIDL